MSNTRELLAAYSARHHGVVSLQKARDLGVSAAEIKNFLRSGRLERRATEVYAVSGSPSTWHQRAMVATASSSGWASHRTAAALWGLDGFTRRQIEVLTSMVAVATATDGRSTRPAV